jgi:hypothetical protein
VPNLYSTNFSVDLFTLCLRMGLLSKLLVLSSISSLYDLAYSMPMPLPSHMNDGTSSKSATSRRDTKAFRDIIQKNRQEKVRFHGPGGAYMTSFPEQDHYINYESFSDHPHVDINQYFPDTPSQSSSHQQTTQESNYDQQQSHSNYLTEGQPYPFTNKYLTQDSSVEAPAYMMNRQWNMYNFDQAKEPQAEAQYGQLQDTSQSSSHHESRDGQYIEQESGNSGLRTSIVRNSGHFQNSNSSKQILGQTTWEARSKKQMKKYKKLAEIVEPTFWESLDKDSQHFVADFVREYVPEYSLDDVKAHCALLMTPQILKNLQTLDSKVILQTIPGLQLNVDNARAPWIRDPTMNEATRDAIYARMSKATALSKEYIRQALRKHMAIKRQVLAILYEPDDRTASDLIRNYYGIGKYYKSFINITPNDL